MHGYKRRTLLLLLQACGDWLPESAGSELAREPIVSQSLGARRSGEAKARAAVGSVRSSCLLLDLVHARTVYDCLKVLVVCHA